MKFRGVGEMRDRLLLHVWKAVSLVTFIHTGRVKGWLKHLPIKEICVTACRRRCVSGVGGRGEGKDAAGCRAARGSLACAVGCTAFVQRRRKSRSRPARLRKLELRVKQCRTREGQAIGNVNSWQQLYASKGLCAIRVSYR